MPAIHVEVYLAAKQLHMEGRDSFNSNDLQKKIADMFDDRRSGITTHINSSCNASAPKNHATIYNYLVRMDGKIRLFRAGDEYHPSREGAPNKPNIDDVPSEYWPLWADLEDEAPTQFQGFTEEHFGLFQVSEKTYRQGDAIGERFKSKWLEWKQFVQLVLNRSGKRFNFFTEPWQNSGNLNNEYFWSRFKDKDRSSYASCISLAIFKNEIIINLTMEYKFEKSGKSQDNKQSFNTWIGKLTEDSIPREKWHQYIINDDGELKITVEDYFKTPSYKAKCRGMINSEPGIQLKLERHFSKDEAIAMGMDIIEEVAESVKILYPFYKEILQKSQETMFLIGASKTMHENLPRYQQMIQEKGAMMYWWSYKIRDEYQTHLKNNAPFLVYIYGITKAKTRAITHVMKVDSFVSAPGNEGLKSPEEDITLEEERGITRLGPSQSQIFKTWLKISEIKELQEPIGIDQFVHYDTRGFINPSLMVNSFAYVRKIPSEEIVTRLVNCINMTIEEFNLKMSNPISVDQMINSKKGFSFDISLNSDMSNGNKIESLSASRYKGRNALLLHLGIESDKAYWKSALQLEGYDVWLKEGNDGIGDVKLEDKYQLTDYKEGSHVKVTDIDLDNFSEESFIVPIKSLLEVLNIKIIPPESLPDKWPMRDIEEILYAIGNSDLVYADELLINLHNCLNALSEKHFLIITGISGTGKTEFTRMYVNALYGLPPESTNNPFFVLVPVQPQWSDRTGLLGYFNPITGKYHRTAMLNHLLRANQDAQHFYYVCLDEMNLAVVEYYFADFLSAMESKQDIELHHFPTAIDDVPPRIKVPDNFFIVGTVNVDETTHQFSPKVLDRAYTVEFNEVDLINCLDKFKVRPEVGENLELIQRVGDFCINVNNVLSPYWLHFAYRTFKEILSYMLFNKISSKPLSYENALDNMMMQKVLPRIKGDERIETLLESLSKLIAQEIADAPDNFESQSIKRLDEMLSELRSFGTCQFWR